MLDHIQIFSIMVGLFLMILFGLNWSADILYRITSKKSKFVLYINSIGFLLSLALCIIPNTEFIFKHKKEPVKESPTYILFFDSSVIKGTHSYINNKALEILNNFLEKTNTKLIITSDDRIAHTTQTNWPIDALKALYKARGIKGAVIGSIPYTKHVLTRRQEINLWCNTTKIKYDGCVILDETSNSTNKMDCVVKVKNLLTDQHIIIVLNKLEMAPNPDMFKERLQTYEESFKSKFGQIS